MSNPRMSTTGKIARFFTASGISLIPSVLLASAVEVIANDSQLDRDDRQDWHALITLGVTEVAATAFIFYLLIRGKTNTNTNIYVAVPTTDPESQQPSTSSSPPITIPVRAVPKQSEEDPSWAWKAKDKEGDKKNVAGNQLDIENAGEQESRGFKI